MIHPKISEFVGNENSRKKVVEWLVKWSDGSKPLLLVGPPGVGKTSFVHALSREFDIDLIELNASDTRNKNLLAQVIFPIFSNASLTGKNFLLFLDEIDGISNREDSGGLDFLLDLFKEPSIRVVMAANKSNEAIKKISKVSKTITFSPIPPRLSMLYLDRILRLQNSSMKLEDRIAVVRNCFGDIRSLLNAAQVMKAGYTTTKNPVLDIDIENMINYFFSSTTFEEALDIVQRADISYSDPRFGQSSEDRRKDILAAFFSSIVMSKIDIPTITLLLDRLSELDVILSRSLVMRNWKILRYFPLILTKSLFYESRNKYIRYNRYSIGFEHMGIFSRAQGLKKTLRILAQYFHTSRSTFGSFYFEPLRQILIRTTEYENLIRSTITSEKEADVMVREISRTEEIGHR
ncbi:MAG: AAA family ATPase [Nitrososphaeraceae archaeon]|nr:AAA family ATPase [Nitrososphaeraceae archaeon]MDW0166463.1 AAA family ATPase [Nitrososphaeraceae archaeon]